MTRRRLLIVLFLCSASAHAADKAADEMKKLQGEWQVVEVQVKGKKLTKDNDPQTKDMQFVIKDLIMTARSQSSGAERKKTFKLDPSKSPKSIDITSLDGHEKGQTAACIYKLEKDRLTICVPYFPPADPSKRPTEFKAGADDGMMPLVLERVPKKWNRRLAPWGASATRARLLGNVFFFRFFL